jgi:bromodomain-containing factor 1
MDLDADGEGEDEISAPAPAPNSLKRAGDELSGPDEKRARELNGSAPAVAPVSAPPAPPAFTTTPSGNVVPPVAYVPVTYQPPEPRNPGPRTRLTSTQHKYLLQTVRQLRKITPQAMAFMAPVDVVLYNIPHYFNIVKKPMDLSTVETKLVVSNPRGPPKDKSKMGNWDESKGRYQSVAEVTEDVRQIWENTRMFNGAEHVVSQNATFLENVYEKALKNLPAEVCTSLCVVRYTG